MKTKKVLIFGCGSVGAHHANAAKTLGYEVFLTDINAKQFIFFKDKLYPKRYKKWDYKIKFINYKKVFNLSDCFDFIIIGTSPKNHISVLMKCKKKLKYKKIIVEKPFCVFNQNFELLRNSLVKEKIFCGFNHILSKSINHIFKIIKEKKLGKIKLVQIEWKEDFNNVMKAHPWIQNLANSYLSNIKIGGGGIHEYSHALHLALSIKSLIFKESKMRIFSQIYYKNIKNSYYDYISNIFFKIKDCLFKININTISNPDIKNIRILGHKGSLLWVRNQSKQQETIKLVIKNKLNKKVFNITRRDDFIRQLDSINRNNEYTYLNNLYNSLNTMNFIKKSIKNNHV